MFREFPALQEILEELDERFIIGLDQSVLLDSKLIFFKIQKAFWYYKDHFEQVIKERRAPSLGMETFGQLLIEESEILSRIYPHEKRESKFREWQDYLRKVPRLGAICVNPSLDKVLMIQPFGRGKKNLQFPRGKLHAGEEHVKAAVREVWEECGIRLENLIDSELYFEAVIDTTLHKLYVVYPVMEELVPSIQCNKEIEQILWVPVEKLPGWVSSSGGPNEGFFGVAPFVPQLKSFVKKMLKDRKPVPSVRILKRPEQAEETEGLEDPTADRFNGETFGTGSATNWSFEDMMNANSQLGVRSTYTDESFEQAYSTRLEGRRVESGGDAILQAFISGWRGK